MRRLLALPIIVLALTSCQPPTHPNAINDFDGKTYDSLLLAHTAMASMREKIRTQYKQFIPTFNTVAHTYSLAYDGYALYRTAPDQNAAKTSLLVSNLATSVAALEHDITNRLPYDPKKATVVVEKAKARRGRMANRPRYEMNLVDILTALQVGSQIAQTVPVVGPYAVIASMVIDATKSAVNSSKWSSGKPIDLALIAPIASI